MTTAPVQTEPDRQGLTAARAVAAYEIGDPSWADVIIEAYLNPAEALQRLRQIRDREDD